MAVTINSYDKDTGFLTLSDGSTYTLISGLDLELNQKQNETVELVKLGVSVDEIIKLKNFNLI